MKDIYCGQLAYMTKGVQEQCKIDSWSFFNFITQNILVHPSNLDTPLPLLLYRKLGSEKENIEEQISDDHCFTEKQTHLHR